MQLYVGTTPEFLASDAQRMVVDTLRVSYLDYYHHEPSRSEETSWRNSLHALASQIRTTGLSNHGIILEMQLPLTSRRLDCMLTGEDQAGASTAVIIELKQWSDAFEAEEDECVLVDYGHGRQTSLHPSVQASRYAEYLCDNRAVFHEEPAVRLDACSWLHNWHSDASSTLLDATKFGAVLQSTPLFCATDSAAFSTYLHQRIGNGDARQTLDKIVSSRFAPSKKLMEHTAKMIAGEPVYVLLDEQRIAYQKILTAARRAKKRRDTRTVIVVQGGPGTGKSVIALNVMADLLRQEITVQHATGSKAFTENLRKTLGTRAGASFRYFNSFTDAHEADIDVLICDESHRIRESSNNQYTSSAKRSSRLQVDELIDAAKVSVFFIDDRQVVRPGEIGSSTLLREKAVEHDARFEEQHLEAQFRCAGSDEYIEWVDALLGIRATESDEFDPQVGFAFEIVASPELLDEKIRSFTRQGFSARLTAGFCWPWSKPRDGVLVGDVRIGSFVRPWNAKPDAVGLPRTIPKSSFWATDPNGLEQVGCVYTAQGFEFDYVGVIWGLDLIYRAEQGGWIGDKMHSHDTAVKRAKPEQFLALLKNTYRVLLTRGLRGTYLYIMDNETRDYVESHLLNDESCPTG